MSPEAGEAGAKTPRCTCAGTLEGQRGGQRDGQRDCPGVGKGEAGGGRAHRGGRGSEEAEGRTGGVQFRR